MQFDGFDWDDGNWPKCGKHGVTKGEIEAVLTDPASRIFPDAAHGMPEVREIAIGRSPDNGHMMAIFFTRRVIGHELLLRPFSARYMHDKEASKYEQR